MILIDEDISQAAIAYRREERSFTRFEQKTAQDQIRAMFIEIVSNLLSMLVDEETSSDSAEWIRVGGGLTVFMERTDGRGGVVLDSDTAHELAKVLKRYLECTPAFQTSTKFGRIRNRYPRVTVTYDASSSSIKPKRSTDALTVTFGAYMEPS